MGKLIQMILWVFFIFTLQAEAAYAQQTADNFIYPVRGRSVPITDVSFLNNSSADLVNKTWDGWYWYGNPFGNYCPNCGGWSGYHEGLDLNRQDGADLNEPVYAVANGIVVDVRNLGNSDNGTYLYYGVIVKHYLPVAEDMNTYTLTPITSWVDSNGVRHNNTSRFIEIWSTYTHVYQVKVSVGQIVKRGDQVGQLANVGGQPHLHFDMRYQTNSNEWNPNAGCRLYGSYRNSKEKVTACGFMDGMKFIATHTAPYTYIPPAVTCAGPVTGGQSTGWIYTCQNPRNSFMAGETAYTLFRLHNVRVDHTYRVIAYKDGAYQWQWTNAKNYTNGYVWNDSYFWPSASNLTAGNWEMQMHLDTGSGFRYIDSARFAVQAPVQKYNYYGYVRACRGPITGGEDTSWQYTCSNESYTYNVGEMVYGLIRLENFYQYTRHRYLFKVYRDGILQWQTDPNYVTWNEVGFWGWRYSHYWNSNRVNNSGNWRYEFYLDVGNGFQFLDKINFTVVGASTPAYTYSHQALTCAGPVTGDQSTGWIYTCQNPKTNFRTTDTAYGLFRVENLTRDFYYKVEVYKDGQLVNNWQTGWYGLKNGEFWGWNYFTVGQWGLSPSNGWEMRVYIIYRDEVGREVKNFLDSLFFTVS